MQSTVSIVSHAVTFKWFRSSVDACIQKGTIASELKCVGYLGLNDVKEKRVSVQHGGDESCELAQAVDERVSPRKQETTNEL